MHPFRAQGATEYLVLLAVVLVVALVSIALLGWFPGTAADTQLTESEIYWRSAYPIAVSENDGTYYLASTDFPPIQNETVFKYLKIKNNGNYRIALSKMFGGNTSIDSYGDHGAVYPLSRITLAPGEEACFGFGDGFHGWTIVPSNCGQHTVELYLATSPSACQTTGSFILCGLSNLCNPDGSGIVSIANFGFEYVEYIENNSVTKRQVGKPLFLMCRGICNVSSSTGQVKC
ncbi:MAG: hypothetical protein QW568_02935 [Candidatus Anstonellaceae archaeon]